MAAVKVFLRERPSDVAPRYTYQQQDQVVEVTTTTPSFHSKTSHSYILDGVFDALQTQEDVFHAVGRYAVANVLNSYSATLICYGATATGKSYTAFGEESNHGLAFRVLKYLFECIEARYQRESYEIYVSLTELYIDRVFDLFTGVYLQIRQDEGGFYCENLTQVKITSTEQATYLLDRTLKNRQTAPNYANYQSSRSHVLFSIGIMQTSREDELTSQSILTICDLAGSESLRKSNASGLRLMEAYYINKSLSALCSVVNQLASKNQFIYYRDSKLTMLLYKSLGGNSFTSVICTVYAEQADESQYTIYFANRCRNVLNNPQVQYTDIGKIEQNALLQKLQKENLELKERLTDLEAELYQQKESYRAIKAFPSQSNAEYSSNTYTVARYYTDIFSGANGAKSQLEQQRQSWQQTAKAANATQLATAGSYKLPATYTAQNGTQLRYEDSIRKDSIAILRQKLVQKNEEIQAQMHYHNKQISEYRQREQYYRERLNELQEQMKAMQESFERYINDAKTEKETALQVISQGADELIQTYRSMAESTLRLVYEQQPDTFGEFEMAEIIEQERIQLSTQMDVYQLEYRYEALAKHKKEIEQMRQRYRAEINEKAREILALKTQKDDFAFAVNWLAGQFTALSNVVMSAREGKLDSFIVNEPDVIYYLLQNQESIGSTLKRERTRIHTCLLLEDVQLPRIPPERVAQAIAQSKPVSRPYSALSMSSRPSSALSLKELRKVGQVYQPRLQTGFIKPKAPNVTLGMNVHISPRPQNNADTASRGDKSHGSCAGTQELVNKQYQQWGW